MFGLNFFLFAILTLAPLDSSAGICQWLLLKLWPGQKLELTSKESDLIKRYTLFLSANLNYFMRTGETTAPYTTAQLTEFAEHLTRALQKLPKFEGIVHRVIYKSDTSLKALNTAESMGQFSDPAFMSTTSNLRTYLKDQKKLASTSGAKYIILSIRSRSGRILPKSLTRFPRENEIIFLPNTRFHFTKSTSPEGTTIYLLEEMD